MPAQSSEKADASRDPITPHVSIVIVSWNAVAYLEECLTSIFGCKLPWPIEVFVVDNASSDGSADMVSSRFPAVRLIRNDQNLGFAKANNIAIRLARAPYLALINSDVHVRAGCLEDLVAYCENNAGAGIVGPLIIGRDGRQQLSCRGFPTLWNTLCRALALDALLPRLGWFNGYLLRHKRQTDVMPADILSGCFWLVRREALERVGLLDEAFFIYGEDMDWCKRFWQAGWSAMFVPKAQAVHYGGVSSANAPTRFSMEMQRADHQYWVKHHRRLAVAAYVAISVVHHSLRAVGHRAASLFSRAPDSPRQLARCSEACLIWLLFRRHGSSRVPQVARLDTGSRRSP